MDSRYMDKISFCKMLVSRVSTEEWQLLENADGQLRINEHNRNSLLEMRSLATGAYPNSDIDTEGAVDEHAARELAEEIQGFLDIHMVDAPEGHKWIVLACLYLTFVAKRPMHPLERAGVTVEESAGRIVYRCPNKVPGDNPICDACACEPANK